MDLAQSLLLSGCKIECGKQAYTQLLPTVLEIGGGTARNILEFQKNFKSVQLLITWLLQFHAIHLPSDNSEPGTVLNVNNIQNNAGIIMPILQIRKMRIRVLAI